MERATNAGLENAALSQLELLYRARDESGLAEDAGLCATIAQRAVSLGEPLLACDVCRLALQRLPGHTRLRQLHGLALARCHAVDQALAVMESLYREGARDEETLGILARIHKDCWMNGAGTSSGESSLARSLQLYSDAFRSGGGYWCGINAATLALVVGEKEQARALAQQVRDQCLAAREPHLWQRATLGEAALLLDDRHEAERWYKSVAGAQLGDRASMRRNARLALRAAGRDPAWIDGVLGSPVVAAFSGHMSDLKSRAVPRFPEKLSQAAGEAIKRRLAADNVRVGYASAASGGDILFHEAMFQLGRESHVVLPHPPEEFVRTSVITGQSAWFERFERVLKTAASVMVHSNSASGDIGYRYNNWMLLGLARLRSRQLDGDVRAYALWDGEPGQTGGTSTAVEDWRGFGQAIEWLAPQAAGMATWRHAEPALAKRPVAGAIKNQRVVSLLFADAVGFSQLPDDCIPGFVEHFLGSIAHVLDRQEQPALTRNTWGDGLYFTFDNLRAAGIFALDLCDMICETNWSRYGLPAATSLRIALHCGPAHEVVDPVIGQRSFTGAHVSRAARIEPVTPAGSVYASQAFAALCECEGVRDFSCEYVGRMPLAKKFGEYPTYSVRKRRAARESTS